MESVLFTKEMKDTHTILVPMMLPIHFQFLKTILNQEGYHIEVLQTTHDSIINEGLQHVHNDTCYPALLVIGQMIDALKSGNYDLDHVALAITQTGGGCRASNYIHLLRKALAQAGYPQIPVISVNFSNLEKQPGFRLTAPICVKLLFGFLYGDMLLWLKNQCLPYERNKGQTKQMIQTWIAHLSQQFTSMQFLHIKENMTSMIADFASIEKIDKKAIPVGIVGEIYMKYSPLGNNGLEDYLIQEGCEPIVSGVLDFGLYCLENVQNDHRYYHRNTFTYPIAKISSLLIQHFQKIGNKALIKEGSFRPMDSFQELLSSHQGVLDRGVKMGEGWLLTSEMVSLIQHGVPNIICCQPFGCLPNHIVAKGMMRKIKTLYPNSNLVAIDYDPSATRVNQENRIKLMLSNARYQSVLQKTPCTQDATMTKQAYVYETK